jgi:hypothetical protein
MVLCDDRSGRASFLNLIFIKGDLPIPIPINSIDMSMMHETHTTDVLHDSTFLVLEKKARPQTRITIPSNIYRYLTRLVMD